MQGLPPKAASAKVKECYDNVFLSNTQAYREVLLGCTIARILDKTINIRHPYLDQSQDAFSGRSLDERVINPFLQSKRIPSSKGPYLSVFRRSIRFEKSTRTGLRDVRGYDAFLRLISFLESTSDDGELSRFLSYLLYRFIQLREDSSIRLSKLQRISLEQYDSLITGLLGVPSGGRIPVILVVATFNTIRDFFKLDWQIAWQGINVSDAASGAGGDITIRSEGKTLMAAEVTERPLDKDRILTTFNTKIAVAGLEDYMFFVKKTVVSPEVRLQARQYFAQGHEINFVDIKTWILMSLSTMGTAGRTIFNECLIELLNAPDMPKTLRVKWNEQIQRITSL